MKLLFLFIFFLLINFNIFVESLKITDLSTKSSLNQYSDGPNKNNSPTCKFVVVLFLELSESTNDIRLFQPEYSQPIYSHTTSPSNDNKTLIYQIESWASDSKNGLIVGNYTFGEKYPNGTIVVSNINKNFYCSAPPLPEKNNIIATDFSLYDNKNMVSYFSIYSWNRANIISLSFIENLKSDICDSDCRIEKSGSYYIIYMKINNFDTITFPINSTYHKNFNFTLTINGIFKNTKKANMVIPTNVKFYPSGPFINGFSVNSYSYSLINLDSDEPIKYLSSNYVNSSGFENFEIQMSQIIFTNKLSQAFLNQNHLMNQSYYEYRYWNNQTINNNINQVNKNEKLLSPLYQIESYINEDVVSGPTFTTNTVSIDSMDFLGLGSINTQTLSFPMVLMYPQISFTKYYSFPFGCSVANESTYITAITQPTSNGIKGLLKVFIGESNVFGMNTSSIPKETLISSLEFIYIGFNKFMVKTKIGGDFYFITSQSYDFDFAVVKATGYDDVGLYSNIFQPSFGQFKDFTTFRAFSFDLKETQLPKHLLPIVPNLNEIIESPIINSLKFEVQSMNTTDVGGLNTVYLGFNNFDYKHSIFHHPSFILSPKSLSSNIHFHKAIPFTLIDENKKLFKAEFYVPANLPTGEVDYSIVNNVGYEYTSSYIKSYLINNPSTDSNVNDTSSLYTYSEYGYSLPPIIKSYSFEKEIVLINDLQNLNRINLTIQLQPSRNQFDNGFISIESSSITTFRKMYFNFTFTNEQLVGGTNDTFTFELKLPCFTSKYEIINVTLIDKQGYLSSFNKYSYNGDITTTIPLPIDPFMIFNTVKGFSVQCNQLAIQESSPIITSLTANLNSIIINSPITKDLQFTLQVKDPIGLMTESQLPFIYLVGGLIDDTIRIPFEIFQYNDTFATFKSKPITVPFGFGLPFLSIPLSVYGICNKVGIISGYNKNQLKEMNNTQIIYDIPIVSINLTNIPIILDSSAFYSIGGNLTLFGKNLQNALSVNVLIQSNKLSYPVIGNQNEGYLTINLQPINEPFYVNITNSNLFLIVPIQVPNKVNEYKIIPSTPIPTNPPQKCIGNPQCGGATHGTCTESGCVCFSPWVGESCNSKVLVITPPIINPNTPSTNFSYHDKDSESEIAGIISLVELREIDYESKPIKRYPFDKWILTKINPNENFYTTSILDNNNNSKLICNVTVSSIWYEQLTVITFADQKITMDPSTLKFNINITSYPFSNKLNTLQLVISASAKGTNNNSKSDYCSSSSYGNTVLDNSNYLKLTINYQSIYGKFIKRGIIDFKTISIGNSQLASNDPIIENDHDDEVITSTFQKSFIAINIPYYVFLAQLDPSFSVLVNPNLNNDENSICSQSNDHSINEKLIIGIVVGVVGFTIALVVVIIIIIKKKHHLRRLQYKIKLKQNK
ncbi:hypothetical protein ACTFIW_012939 [Dictyostelium discoideum]